MTAPRRSARPGPSPKQPLWPNSLILFFASACLAVVLPTGAALAESRIDNNIALVAAIFGMSFVVVAVFLRAIKRRSGLKATVVLPAVVSAGLITATYAGTAIVVSEANGPDHDFLSLADLSLGLGVPLLATFIIVYATLSMART